MGMSEADDTWEAAMEEYDERWDDVQDMFPKAKFSVCFDKETLASELAKEA